MRISRTPLTLVSILGALALTLRAVTTLIDNPDFGAPGDGWRSTLQLVVAAALVFGVTRPPETARRVVGAVAALYVAMTIWERFSGDSFLFLVTVTARDHWAHPVIAALAAATAAWGSGVANPARSVTVRKKVDAPPSAVFSLLTDLETFGRLSPETIGCTWTSDRRGVGAEFEGHNRDEQRTWSTTCVITAFDPDRTFAFEVRRPATISRWTYEVTGHANGCEVRETWDDLRNPLVRAVSVRRSGIADRAAHNAKTMDATLRRLETLALATTSRR